MDINITGSGDCTGGLVGSNSGDVTASYSTGVVNGIDYVGGLVGWNSDTVTRCYSTTAVNGKSCVGGLVGVNDGAVTRCCSTGSVAGRSNVGGLVGWIGDGALIQCHSTCVVSGDQYVGGLAGGSYSSSVGWYGSTISCYSAGIVDGDSSVGGLIGYTCGGTVRDCHSTASVSGRLEVGGLIGSSFGEGVDFTVYYTEISYCYSAGPVDGKASTGGLIGYNDGVVLSCFWDTQTSGQTTSDGGTGKTTAEMKNPNTFSVAGWDSVGRPDGPHDIWGEPEGGGYPILWWQLSTWPPLPFDGGSGQPDDPYLISTPEQLNSIGHNPRLMKCHFKLLADLDMTGVHFYPIGHMEYPYGGIFDGSGHTISHLTIIGESDLGLFGWVASGAEVKDLGLMDANIVGSGSDVGVLAGYNSGTVLRCYSTGTISGYNGVGGLVGRNDYGYLTRCHSAAAVSGTERVGGLVGHNSGTLAQCYSAAVVSGTEGVGGLVGENFYYSNVTQCYSTGAVTVTGIGMRAGGLVGENYGYFTQCYSTGAVTGIGAYVGGLVGLNGSVSVTGSFWDMQTSGRATSAGGMGKTTAQMQAIQTYRDAGWDFWATTEDGPAEIWQMPEAGGYPILAVFNGYTPPQLRGMGTPHDPYTIADARELGAVIYYSPYAHYRLANSIDLSGIRWGAAVIPWFAGVFDGSGHTISHLTIMGENDLGLFGSVGYGAEVKDLGLMDANIVRSGSYVGALAGSRSGGTVLRCYSTGAVSGDRSVGGLVGLNYGYLTQCYSTGTISGDDDVGGLVGYNSGSVTQCYSTAAVTGDTSVGGLVGYGGSGSVTQCYSTGAVSGTSSVGGLVGSAYYGSVTACFWDTQTSGQTTSAGGTGKTTVEMRTASPFLDAGWDFVGETKNGTADIWWILEGKDYPHLWWELVKDKVAEPVGN